MKTLYKRVLLKLSGEGLSGDKGFGVDSQAVLALAEQIKKIVKAKIEVCIVVGGGNIFRGAKDCTIGLDRSQADQLGMMATIMNATVLRGALSHICKKDECSFLQRVPAILILLPIPVRRCELSKCIAMPCLSPVRLTVFILLIRLKIRMLFVMTRCLMMKLLPKNLKLWI